MVNGALGDDDASVGLALDNIPTYATDDDYKAMVGALERESSGTPYGQVRSCRDSLIVSLIFNDGLPGSEIVGLDTETVAKGQGRGIISYNRGETVIKFTLSKDTENILNGLNSAYERYYGKPLIEEENKPLLQNERRKRISVRTMRHVVTQLAGSVDRELCPTDLLYGFVYAQLKDKKSPSYIRRRTGVGFPTIRALREKALASVQT